MPTGNETVPPADAACAEYESPEIYPSAALSGANAFAFMLFLVCDFSAASARDVFRIPGTEAQQSKAMMLHDTLADNGWQAQMQNFTGADYMPLDKGAASSWYSDRDDGVCSPAQRQRLRTLPFHNVVGSLPGAGPENLILMAHWDSKRTATADPNPARRGDPVLGANDGAAGVGLLLEVSRAWANRTLPWTTTILLTDGEDGFDDCHPLAGSVYYAQTLSQQQVQAVRGVILFDMVGNPNLEFMLSTNDPDMADQWRQAGLLAGVDQMAQAKRGTVVDDHVPFMERGIPALDIIPARFFDTDFWHTTSDVPQKISPDFLEQVGRTLERYVELEAAG